MSSNNAAIETALLEIAKDLLQASDDLASTDPSASAKLAHEAYEIGRDLGVVRNHLDGAELASALESATLGSDKAVRENANEPIVDEVDDETTFQRRDVEDEADAELFRILDRQKALLPKPVELAPVRKPSRGTRSLSFESATPRRSSGWFGWMRPREWRHAG